MIRKPAPPGENGAKAGAAGSAARPGRRAMLRAPSKEGRAMKHPILALAGAGILAACAALDTTPPEDTHVVCQTETLAWTIGKTADETLVRRAQLEATGKVARVLRPGQMVTMEYSDQRLNLYVDANNVVERYSCS
jgi:hypothetical protein